MPVILRLCSPTCDPLGMQTDALLPKGEQRGYTSVSHALTSIVRGEGVAGLFKVRG